MWWLNQVDENCKQRHVGSLYLSIEQANTMNCPVDFRQKVALRTEFCTKHDGDFPG